MLGTCHGEEKCILVLWPWDGGSAPCPPHLSYTQHMCVRQGIKTSQAASGRRFVIRFVSLPEMKIVVLCPGSWPGAELSKDPVFHLGAQLGFPERGIQIQLLALGIPFPTTHPPPCVELSPIIPVSLSQPCLSPFILIPSRSATSPVPPPSQPSLYHQKITLAPPLSASGCLSAISLKRSPKPGLENSPFFYLMQDHLKGG